MYKTAKEEIGEWRKLAGNGDWEESEALDDEARGRLGEGRFARGYKEKGDHETKRLRDLEIKRHRKKGRTFADQY